MGASMVFEIATYTVMAAVLVFIIMNADKFAVAIGTLGGWATTEESIYTGGYKAA